MTAITVDASTQGPSGGPLLRLKPNSQPAAPVPEFTTAKNPGNGSKREALAQEITWL